MMYINQIKKNTPVVIGVGILLAVLLAAVLTFFISKWSSDKASVDDIRIQNLLTMQKDSLTGVFLNEKLKEHDSIEAFFVNRLKATEEYNKQLIKKDKANSETIKSLKSKFDENVTIENCIEYSKYQEEAIKDKDDLIDSLDYEAEIYSKLYYNEKKSGIIKDTLIAGKDRTIQTLNNEVEIATDELKTITTKIEKTSWFKRNWLWATNSYRNYLKNTK